MNRKKKARLRENFSRIEHSLNLFNERDRNKALDQIEKMANKFHDKALNEGDEPHWYSGVEALRVRQEQNLSIYELGRIIGCSGSYISKLERGDMFPRKAYIQKDKVKRYITWLLDNGYIPKGEINFR